MAVNISRPGNGPWGMLRAGLMHTPAATRYEDRRPRHTAVDAPQYRATAGTRRGTQLCVLRGLTCSLASGRGGGPRGTCRGGALGAAFMPDNANAGLARQAIPSASALVRAGRRRSLVWLVVAVAMSVLAACSPSPPDDGPLVDLRFEKKYTLGNGVEVILREDHRVPIAAVNLWRDDARPANEEAGPHGLRAPVRAHDVPGLEH